MKTLKKLALLPLFCGLLLANVACNNKKNETDVAVENDIEQTEINNLEISDLLNLITRSGSLIEMKTYDVGRFRNIRFQVVKMTDLYLSKTSVFAQIEINWADRFHYFSESTIILQREIPDFINAIEVIRNNYVGTTKETETIVGFISSGNVRIRAIYRDNRWRYDFHVNHRRNDAGVSFAQGELDNLITLFNRTDEKINALSQMAQNRI